MSYTKNYIDQEMEQGNDVLHIDMPDDSDIDYQTKQYGYATRCPHDYQPLSDGGRICTRCDDYISPEDIFNSLRDMDEDDKRGRDEETRKEDENESY